MSSNGPRLLGFFSQFMKNVKESLALGLNTLLFYQLLKNRVGDVTYCSGPSMYPTFNVAGDVIIIDRLTPQYGELREGDVVLCVSPKDPTKWICKRLIALEGSTVKYVPTVGRSRPQEIRIPKGHVWLEGDNKQNSTDSRFFGPVPMALVFGKAFYKIWPIPEAGPIRNNKLQDK